MTHYLIYTNGEKTGEGELLPGEHIAGRSRSADIHLEPPDISGKHVKLEVLPEKLLAENLSSHGTLLNGVPLTERRELRGNDVLSLGKHLELRFENLPDTAGKPPEEERKTFIPAVPVSAEEDPDKTRIPGAAAPVLPAMPENAGTPPPDAAPAPAPKKAEEEPFKTDLMKTRLASVEEMNQLRHADRKRSAGKFLQYLLAALGAIAVLILLYTLKAAPKESSLSWPTGPDGRELGAFADPGNGGHRGGAFSLAYPSLKGKTVKEEKPGRITVLTRCGKDGSVPLRIIFIQKSSPAFLNMERKQVMSGMLAELQKDDRRWNIAQISDVFFIGSENGLPCLSVEYRREADKQSWHGEILFFRTGDRAFMRLAEIPASERARGQSFISNMPFLKFAPGYLQTHWEGNARYRYDGDPAVMMNEIARHLSKQAPFEWARSYLLLQNTLMESVKRKDAVLRKNALAQLRRLRAMQTVWYNSQKIQYNTARLNNDRHRENAVKELCKTVFSSPDDLRYFTLRRNLWE